MKLYVIFNRAHKNAGFVGVIEANKESIKKFINDRTAYIKKKYRAKEVTFQAIPISRTLQLFFKADGREVAAENYHFFECELGELEF